MNRPHPLLAHALAAAVLLGLGLANVYWADHDHSGWRVFFMVFAFIYGWAGWYQAGKAWRILRDGPPQTKCAHPPSIICPHCPDYNTPIRKETK